MSIVIFVFIVALALAYLAGFASGITIGLRSSLSCQRKQGVSVYPASIIVDTGVNKLEVSTNDH
jgi:hypothetical protein